MTFGVDPSIVQRIDLEQGVRREQAVSTRFFPQAGCACIEAPPEIIPEVLSCRSTGRPMPELAQRADQCVHLGDFPPISLICGKVRHRTPVTRPPMYKYIVQKSSYLYMGEAGYLVIRLRCEQL